MAFVVYTHVYILVRILRKRLRYVYNIRGRRQQYFSKKGGGLCGGKNALYQAIACNAVNTGFRSSIATNRFNFC